MSQHFLQVGHAERRVQSNAGRERREKDPERERAVGRGLEYRCGGATTLKEPCISPLRHPWSTSSEPSIVVKVPQYEDFRLVTGDEERELYVPLDSTRGDEEEDTTVPFSRLTFERGQRLC